MRTIKFRGKTEKGEWLYGDLLHSFGGKVAITHIDDCFPGGYVIPETVGQFTGLTDKNGKEIYEGDIVRYFANGNAEIEFYHGGWVVMGKYDYDSFDSLCAYIEVIGNIHDNPELLEDPK